MKIKTAAHLVSAVTLALSALSAQALNVTNDIALVGSASSLSAGLSDPTGIAVNHTVSGTFTDTLPLPTQAMPS